MSTTTFTEDNLAQLKARGISAAAAAAQLEQFRNGFPFLTITGAATVGNGIKALTLQEQDACVQRFDAWGGTRAKFVPASGAATRMFKDLYQPEGAQRFLEHVKEFPFYEPLAACPGVDMNQPQTVLDALLTGKGLGYSALPKGVLVFHKNPDGTTATAFEEHLCEAALYARDAQGVARVHFTVSPAHRPLFEALFEQVRARYEAAYHVRYEISYSEQKPSTDTLAATAQNEPLRNEKGELVLRPGGHGALLENLGERPEELLFIKNIDNVLPQTALDTVVRWKKIIGGLLLEYRARIAAYLDALQEIVSPEIAKVPAAAEAAAALRAEVAAFLAKDFCIAPAEVAPEALPTAAQLIALLDRPLRVCGMVRNTGEAGGGPYKVLQTNGFTSLQILEGAQLPPQAPAATHFNPVDIACCIQDYHGVPYDLMRFRDPATGFISSKQQGGVSMKVLELPGLWNGSMSYWNTLFVEVPLETFNPVKSVFDLLRPEHKGVN